MEYLTKKVETIKKQLDELLAEIRNTLASNHGKQRQSRRTTGRQSSKEQSSMAQIFDHLVEISTELATIKCLTARLSNGRDTNQESNPIASNYPFATPPKNQHVTTLPEPPSITAPQELLSVPSITTPPVTTPPVTAPPVTAPPVTAPPVTAPPITAPPVTAPPVTAPPITAPPVTAPPVTTPPITAPPVTTPPVTAPPVTAPPVTAPPVTTPPVTTPPVTTPPEPLSPNEYVTGPVFQCNYEDIKNLNEAMFEIFSSDPIAKKKGYFKLVVHGLPPLAVDRESICEPGEGYFTSFSCKPDKEGFVELVKKPSREITFPEFPLPEPERQSWSRKDLKESWEATLKDPPQDMTYVIGEPLFSDIILSSGQGLEKRGGSKLQGVGTPYGYFGFKVSGSIMHGEDANLCSMNALRSGAPKHWLLIEPDDKEKLEDHMRQEFPAMKTCSQALRHLSRFIPPSKLDAWGIRYSLDSIYPGEAMFTLPKTLHQVINDGTNYAIAINVLCDTSSLILEGYKFCAKEFCQKNCDQHSITEAHLQLQNRHPLAAIQAKKVQRLPRKPSIVQKQSTITRNNPTRRLNAPTSAQSQVVGAKRKAAPDEVPPKKPKITPPIQLLSNEVCGKEAFHRLSALVYSWRDRWRSFEFSKDGDSTAQLVHIISLTEERSQLDQVQGRILKVKVAENIDNEKAGRISADPNTLNKLMDELNWERTKANRTKLHGYLKEGRQWAKIRGTFHGLLCLIPTHREGRACTSSRYYELAESDIRKFHSLLDSSEFVKSLCRIGNILESSANIPQFKWEIEDPQRLSRLSIKELAPLIDKCDS